MHAGKELENELPSHAYTNNYAPDFRLHIPVRTGKENLNTPERIARLRDELLQNIGRSATGGRGGGEGGVQHCQAQG